ncbi:MAG: acyl--CoA ligase [Gammaproteobacteria bacterium]|nr:acyl--CoA ligase [Gammaproteobacteria bacterium]
MRTTKLELIAEYRARGWWSDTRIPDLFDDAVRSNPHGSAVVDAPNREQLTGMPALRLSFADVQDFVASYMRQFHELGLRRDHILITQLPNIAEYVAVYIAALKLGIVVSPVPMQFRHRELQQIMQLTAARGLLTLAHFKGEEPTREVRVAAEGRELLLMVLGEQVTPGAVTLPNRAANAPAVQQAEQLALAAGVSADDIATICWTSGTEGLPKGVPRSHNHWLAISQAHFDGAGLRRGDVLLNPFPLVNMAALGGCFMSWLHGAGTLVLHHPFDASVYLQQIARDRPSYAIAPPAILNMLLKNEQLLAQVDLSSLRCIGSGSAPLDPAMIRGFKERFNIDIVNLFGSNEGVSLVSSAAEAPTAEQRASLFPRFGRRDVVWPQRIAQSIETRLIDPESGAEILTPGQTGEMQIRGPTVFDGYFRAPKLTAAAFTSDGFFRTGDLFEIVTDSLGPRFYRFVSRLKQLIVRGGVKIAPEEVEVLLAQHPAVLEAAAIAYPDPILGQRICAVLVPRPGAAPPTLGAIQALFREQGVTVFKWPERVRIASALPRNPLGKVVRAELAPLAAVPDNVAES